MHRTILITAATGQVSSTVIEKLDRTGRQLRVLVRDPSKARSLGARGVEVYTGDLDDPFSLAPALEGRPLAADPQRPTRARAQHERALGRTPRRD